MGAASRIRVGAKLTFNGDPIVLRCHPRHPLECVAKYTF